MTELHSWVMEKKWLIELQGNNFDLQTLSMQLCSSDLSVTEENGIYYLKSKEFNFMKEIGEVYISASKLIEFINSSAKIIFGKYYTVSVARVIRFDDNGQGDNFVIARLMRAECRVELRVFLSMKQTNNSVQQSCFFERLIGIAKQDERVAKALRMWGSREHNWHNLYHVYEVVEGNVGSMSKIIQNGWATEPEIKLFKRTACNENVLGDEARHGYSKDLDLKNPMSLAKAESLIEGILKKWLRAKCP